MRILAISALLAIPSIVAATLVAPQEVHACICDPAGSQELAGRIDLVVVARFVSREASIDPAVTPSGLKVTLEVERYLKGSGPEVIDVYDSPTSCGVGLGSPVGGRWLVFAYSDDTGALRTDKCTGTIRIEPMDVRFTSEDDLAEHLRAFETMFGAPGALVSPGAFPDGGGGNQPAHATGLWIVPLLAAGAAAGAAGLLLLTAGRRRARP
jgi:hypothetical protein